jgi:uncharacterized LabA/DUF88 family protein
MSNLIDRNDPSVDPLLYDPSQRHRPNGAVLLDFVNLHAGIHNAHNLEQCYGDFVGRHPQLFSPKSLMAQINARFGDVVVAKAYANWNFFVRYLDEVRNSGIEPVFTNDRYEKNTDRVIIADAVEIACTVPKIDFFIIGSGDRDFVPLAQKLRMRKVRVFGIGIQGSISDELRAACDEYVTVIPSGEWPTELPKVTGHAWPRLPMNRNGYAGTDQ